MNAWELVHGEDQVDVSISRVIDGDSVLAVYLEGEDFEVENLDFEVRLYGIDAPEMISGLPVQPMAHAARDHLDSLTRARGDVFRFDCIDRDFLGDAGRGLGGVRLIGVLSRLGDGEPVNLRMVRAGLAWDLWDQLAGAEPAEAEARHFSRGIWSLPEDEREAPWDFRKRHLRGSWGFSWAMAQERVTGC